VIRSAGATGPDLQAFFALASQPFGGLGKLCPLLGASCSFGGQALCLGGFLGCCRGGLLSFPVHRGSLAGASELWVNGQYTVGAVLPVAVVPEHVDVDGEALSFGVHASDDSLDQVLLAQPKANLSKGLALTDVPSNAIFQKVSGVLDGGGKDLVDGAEVDVHSPDGPVEVVAVVAGPDDKQRVVGDAAVCLSSQPPDRFLSFFSRVEGAVEKAVADPIS